MTARRDQTIDMFRGIAILLVVLFHFTARLPAYALNITEGAPLPVFFGWVGVYFFFVISGYCIFMTLERSETVGVFLARRISRIYPAFVAAVLILFVFGLVAYIPSVPEAKFHVIPPNLLDVVMNLFFIGEIGEWVDGSFWSIAVEVKFYLLVALLAGIFHDRSRFTQVFAWLALVMAPVWAFSTFFSYLGSGPVTPQSLLKFLAIAPYLSFFAVGILGRQFEAGTKGTGRLLAANVVVSTIVVWIEAYSFELHDGWLTATICALAYAALVALFLRFVMGKPFPTIPGLSRGIAQIGLLSFSWYLIHENVGISMLTTLDLYMPAHVALLATVIATFLLAICFAALFEWRFRKPVERLAMAVLDWIGQRVRWLAPLRSAPMAQPAAE
ncbi:acyltransferase [Devosia sp.]|uniref:acyltransferase family protein n=1 Tax=Devosia sp. TaxID=1871048 RepID=UPI001ACB10DB|nr:acyltransferase [Devosia sp.]MBN9335655.1 acyltransferase [Devosia sp.]